MFSKRRVVDIWASLAELVSCCICGWISSKCTGCYIDIFDSCQVWTLSLSCANSFDMGSVPRVSSASIHTILAWRGRERRSIFTVINVMVGYSTMHGCLWRIVSFGCFRYGGMMILLLALLITNCRKHGGLGPGNPRKGCGIQGDWVHPQQTDRNRKFLHSFWTFLRAAVRSRNLSKDCFCIWFGSSQSKWRDSLNNMKWILFNR